jgi:hypothetical protein
MNVADFKSLVSVLESIAKIAALGAAGWWTFVLFVQKREKYPRARTTHSLVLLGKIGGHNILRLSVKVENLGNVLIDLRRGRVSIQSVRPMPDAWKEAILEGGTISRIDGGEFPWPNLDDFPFEWGENGYRIEPLESEEFHFDLTLGIAIEAVQVYSYFKNLTEKGRELGWNCTTVQPIPRGDDYGEQTASSTHPQAAAESTEAARCSGSAQAHNQTGATEANATEAGR